MKVFEFADKKIGIELFGKYCPNMLFICPDHQYNTSKEELSPFRRSEAISTPATSLLNCGGNMPLVYLKGKYFKSKKGTECFTLQEDGQDMIIRIDWGGAFASWFAKDATAIVEKFPDRKKYVRASSNGGGIGYDYIILPVGAKWNPTIDDI